MFAYQKTLLSYDVSGMGVDLTGLLGGHKRRLGAWGTKSPSGVLGRSPGRGLGDEVPQKLKLFCETTHNNCIKIQQQQLLLLLDKINDITSKILGGGDMSPLSHRDRRPCILQMMMMMMIVNLCSALCKKRFLLH